MKRNDVIVRHEINPRSGRDLIVGDIHGHFTKLEGELHAIGFDESRDRLFSVGDLVDRGPESHLALDWLRRPWFHAVRGNHEEAAIGWHTGDLRDERLYRDYGAAWNIDASAAIQHERALAFAQLPLGIELQTPEGLVGIAHADFPLSSWLAAAGVLAAGGLRAQALADSMTEGRERWKRLFDGPVHGLRGLVVGHQPVHRMQQLDNILFIDTYGWQGLPFTILDAATLQPAPAPGQVLQWNEQQVPGAARERS